MLISGISEIHDNGTQVRLTEYDVRLLTRTHLSQLMILQDVIVSGLQQPDLFEPYQLSWIQDRIENRGYIIGAFDGENLAAFCHVYYPDTDDAERNYGFDMGFNEVERLHVVNLHMFCVHPRYRGNGLAIMLNRLALSKMQQDASRHYHICSSVSPYNLYSLRVLMDAGLFIKKLTHKYGGKLRYIVHRDLRHSDPLNLDALNSTLIQSAAAGNLSAHQQLLDDGYWGFKLIQPTDGLQASRHPDFHNGHVVFGKEDMMAAEGETAFRQSRFGFGLRIILIVLSILAATQALGTYLSLLSFEKIYIRTAASKYEILGKSLKRKIEQSLKLGKSIDNFVGMGRLAAPLYQQLPDLDEIFISDSNGKLIFSSGKAQVIMARSLSDIGDSNSEIISGHYQMPDSVPLDSLFDWNVFRPTLRPHGGRYYVMLPIDAGVDRQKAALGLVFNRSSLEASKIELLRSTRFKLIVSIITTAILIGLLIRYLFIKPASQFMSNMSDTLFRENHFGMVNNTHMPEELLEINLNIVDFVNQVYAFKHEAAGILDQLSIVAAPDSTTAAHIRQMKHILFHKADETTNTES